jgi:hypothetical protein
LFEVRHFGNHRPRLAAAIENVDALAVRGQTLRGSGQAPQEVFRSVNRNFKAGGRIECVR